jgi:hypothetical protein
LAFLGTLQILGLLILPLSDFFLRLIFLNEGIKVPARVKVVVA